MGKKIWAALLLFCLLLTACHRPAAPEPEPAPDSAPSAGVPIPPANIPIDSQPEPVFLDRLTIEIVAEWGETDRILSQLEELSRLAGEALEEKGCTVDNPVTITIGTAGGITAQALCDGGVDAAILPTSDYETIVDHVSAILHSMDNDTTMAVTLFREELDNNFQAILSAALLETDAGQEFLKTCYPETMFSGMNSWSFPNNSRP